MALTASVVLSRVFIGLVEDPTQYVTCGTTSRSEAIARAGTFRSYANNVNRLILGSTVIQTESMTLVALTPAQMKKLDSFVGKTVLFRDSYGRRVYGSFIARGIVDIPLSGYAQSSLKTNVQIDFQQVSYDEAV